ncbi:MAG: UDP-N-acetylglucosamine 1-carboxyvinyltransferase [Rickettsiaceae bacterium]|nr:UDP-N-acetylglucosamine 1-carboxyvinyltransferase [Rickettsiaceae bacterium]
MDSILIRGGKPLIGEITISGSKNASLPLMAASLLTEQTLELTNIPQLSDITTMKQLLANHGTAIESTIQNDDSLTLQLASKSIDNYLAPYDIVRKMRASIWVLGPLLARFGDAKVSLPGGCAIGARQVDLHIAVMEAMGATIEIEKGYIHATIKGRLQGCHFSFSKPSVGATINAILSAVLAEGEMHLSNCAREPEIVDLCHCLNQMGAEISGINTGELIIIGKKELFGTSYRVLPDRIEAGTYMIAAAATKGDVKLLGINYDIVENLASRMKEAGVHIESGKNYIHVKHNGAINAVNISTQPYPGFSTDLQAQFMCLMVFSSGSSMISENIFENRFMHVPELCRMGANIIINGNNAVVKGVDHLTGAEVMASDLRASVSLIIAGLCATGETKVRRIYHLDRGYQSLEKKLASCGADISRIIGDVV